MQCTLFTVTSRLSNLCTAASGEVTKVIAVPDLTYSVKPDSLTRGTLMKFIHIYKSWVHHQSIRQSVRTPSYQFYSRQLSGT